MIQRLPFSVDYWTGCRDRVQRLRAGTHFQFDVDAINHFCLFDLPPRLVDFLRIASAIYVVDRLVNRRSPSGVSKPARTLGLRVEVLEEAFWNRPKVRDIIAESIDFISGDFWDFDFTKDPSVYFRSSQLLPNLNEERPPLIALYSGGLDSAAGLASRIADNPSRAVVAVSVWHQPRQRDLLLRQYDVLRTRFHSQIDHLIVKVAMIWSQGLDKKRQERSQRCRSFLFTALGAITAIMQGQRTVEMFESGVGAINLPLMAGMVGSNTTRSSHPHFLRLMSRLASHVAERDVEFSLPFFGETKGQIVKRLADLNLHELANMTASCVGFPLRDSLAKQCGICPACLFRRQAIHVAGISEPDGSYKYDIFDLCQMESVSVERLQYLKAFLMQIAQLDGLETKDRLPRAFERHVLSTKILRPGESPKGVIELLARYRNEWIATALHARRNGHLWAKWLDPPRQIERHEQGVTYASAW